MNVIQRILLILGIIIIVGGAIKLFGFDKLDVCDDSDLIQNMTESSWKLKGGQQMIEFNENGTFTLNRPFNNDGVSLYQGTYRLLNDCHLLFPNAEIGSEYRGVEIRHVELNFLTDGELNRLIGKTIEIDFTSSRYNTLNLHGTTYYKEWDFSELTKSN